MGLMEKMEEFFDKQVNQLNEKEQKFVLKLRSFIFGTYNNWIKPLLSAIFMFFLFTNLKKIIGQEEATYILLIAILIYLRIISRKL